MKTAAKLLTNETHSSCTCADKQPRSKNIGAVVQRQKLQDWKNIEWCKDGEEVFWEVWLNRRKNHK
jgi:hypothetical protein